MAKFHGIAKSGNGYRIEHSGNVDGGRWISFESGGHSMMIVLSDEEVKDLLDRLQPATFEEDMIRDDDFPQVAPTT